jgi:hypothetical protein
MEKRSDGYVRSDRFGGDTRMAIDRPCATKWLLSPLVAQDQQRRDEVAHASACGPGQIAPATLPGCLPAIEPLQSTYNSLVLGSNVALTGEVNQRSRHHMNAATNAVGIAKSQKR